MEFFDARRKQYHTGTVMSMFATPRWKYTHTHTHTHTHTLSCMFVHYVYE